MYFCVTLQEFAILLPVKSKSTLAALRLRRRHQTEYYAHTHEAADMFFRVVEVMNVRVADARSAAEQRQKRKASRWYVKEGTTLGARS
jgi:ribosomal protein L30/L7E